MRRLQSSVDLPIQRRIVMRTLTAVSRLVNVVLALLFAIAVTCSAARAQSFTTIDVPGAIATQAQGINPAGRIVGAYQDANSLFHGLG